MTAFATCLFALAALASLYALLATLHRFVPAAMALRAELEACRGTMTIEWKMVERVTVPALASLRKRPSRRTEDRPGLDWPTLEIAA
ncbi:hypothetical protein [Novosphingobium sp. P6W]|uniref:hypothetical protein n=1 Tax=Novosphingobium sp. P6W TaxID=1609758 RepID=UPI0013B44A1F|nr:hypothetical protein [Novosphingobium sp. P6W]